VRNEDSASAGIMRNASNALTQIYTWQLSDWRSLSSSLSLTLRSKEFTDEFKQHGDVNTSVMLLRSQSRYTPLQRAIETDLYYEFSSERSARMERVFVRVTPGSGNYKYLGDLNGNGIQDENEFELTRFDGDYVALVLPTDQLFPVVDLRTSVRFRLQPARLLPSASTTVEKILRSLSTETYARVDERSTETDTKQIYLLHFSHFQNDRTTITGSNQFTQDLFVFENSPDLSFRFRFNQRRGLMQLVTSTERSFLQERSVRIRSQLIPEIGNQTDYTNGNDRLTSTETSPRQRDLTSNTVNSDFSYRPYRQWEIGWTLSVAEILNHASNQLGTADINTQALRLVYAIPSIGQLRSELSREEALLKNTKIDPQQPLPYEFTNGKTIGKTILWQISFEYRLTQNTQLTLNYNGRSEGGGVPVHFFRAEARAFF
jgi:hypothetical protein